MLLIACPYCGPREQSEFTYGGEAHIDLPDSPNKISDEEWDQVAPNVKDHEPSHALRGGSDGLHFIRSLIQQASTFLDHPGQLAIEIAASQSDAVLELASAAVGLENPSILSDHESLPRVLVANVK